VARPASTSSITGADGEPLAGSVAELTTVELNGRDQPLMIRGYDIDNPVLLFLAGGPGGSELGAMRRHLPGLEEHFTVVTWDQRGTGKAYPQLDPTETVTLDGYVDDTVAVTDYLRDRFGQDRIYLAGQSWGSTLGVMAVQQAPERYRALIGVGQMVSQLATDTTELPVPVFFVQGEHEAGGRQQPFQEWYSTLDAPSKDVIYLDTSGHRPMFEQPDEFVAYMVDTVLADATAG
jgi:pimeloyl-ACP methyl ester carboxylesterase